MIIAVTDRKICRKEFMGQVEAIASSRPDMLILREKDMTESGYGRLAVQCSEICGRHNVPFCVNSFIDVAAAIGSVRIQMPFAAFADNIERLKDFKERWVSVHSADEAAEAERMGATHLIFGNVYETSCKPGAEGKGVPQLRKITDSVNIPVFAIGGISAENVNDVMGTGCAGICVRSILMDTESPGTVMEGLRQRCAE